MSKIGLFSGTFDPIHVGHIEACFAAKAACDLEQILVLVEQKPYRKQQVTEYLKRKEMVNLALADFLLINYFDTHEPNISFTTTLPILKKRFPGAKFMMIVGSDMLEHMETWGNVDTVELCVVLRDNHLLDKTKAQLNKLKKIYPKLKFKIIPAVESTISSSVVRSQIAKTGQSEELHRRVLRYIKQQGLYEASMPKSK